jgi:hypothetical protein
MLGKKGGCRVLTIYTNALKALVEYLKEKGYQVEAVGSLKTGEARALAYRGLRGGDVGS